MRMTKLLAAAGALSLAAAPVLAQAADQVPSRAASQVSNAEDLHGGAVWVGILALAAIIIGIIAATSGDDDNLPHSP